MPSYQVGSTLIAPNPDTACAFVTMPFATGRLRSCERALAYAAPEERLQPHKGLVQVALREVNLYR